VPSSLFPVKSPISHLSQRDSNPHRYNEAVKEAPTHLDLNRQQGLTISWPDGHASFYPIAYLRRMSPSADAKQIREELKQNPLTVLPATNSQEPLTAESAELVGNYAVRIRFSDGHDTGLFSWRYLRQIDPDTTS
jgi:DUF971 family protein